VSEWLLFNATLTQELNTKQQFTPFCWRMYSLALNNNHSLTQELNTKQQFTPFCWRMKSFKLNFL
jgi:hypothetical protein